jgi:2-C-methyl-D-erythritol 4-phosphate cytidylyltransferase
MMTDAGQGCRMVTLGAVVVAAGTGSRMGSQTSKQYLPLGGLPILVHTLKALQKSDLIADIVLVVGASDVAECQSYKEQYGISKLRKVSAGGKERQQSVRVGLDLLNNEWVIIHDGVRPFIEAKHIELCWQAAMTHGAAVVAVPVKDTIKVADESERVSHTPDRNSLWAIQTPQAFRREDLLRAHQVAEQDSVIGTDDASLIERIGIPVKLVKGSYSNIKITTPEDLLWAEYHLASKRGEER